MHASTCPTHRPGTTVVAQAVEAIDLRMRDEVVNMGTVATVNSVDDGAIVEVRFAHRPGEAVRFLAGRPVFIIRREA